MVRPTRCYEGNVDWLFNFNKRDKDEVKRANQILHDLNIGYAGILTSIPAFMFPQPLNQFEHDFFSLYHLFVVTGRLDLIQLCEKNDLIASFLIKFASSKFKGFKILWAAINLLCRTSERSHYSNRCFRRRCTKYD